MVMSAVTERRCSWLTSVPTRAVSSSSLQIASARSARSSSCVAEPESAAETFWHHATCDTASASCAGCCKIHSLRGCSR